MHFIGRRQIGEGEINFRLITSLGSAFGSLVLVPEIGLTPHLFAPRDYPALWDLGIGLTDIAKFAYGMDHQLPKGSLGQDAADALKARIQKVAPRFLAFTSLTAGRTVMGKHASPGRQSEKVGITEVWILPSPSPLASNHWDIAPWRALAKAVRRAR